MNRSTAAQRDALRTMWPEIGPYCLAHGLRQDQLLNGNQSGIPVDGRKLNAARADQFLTRAELARMAGVSKDMLAKIEYGVRSPSPVVLAAITSALGIPVTVLLWTDGTPASHFPREIDGRIVPASPGGPGKKTNEGQHDTGTRK